MRKLKPSDRIMRIGAPAIMTRMGRIAARWIDRASGLDGVTHSRSADVSLLFWGLGVVPTPVRANSARRTPPTQNRAVPAIATQMQRSR